MTQKICINGELVDSQDAKVSVYDHGLLYGDGVFEGLRSYNGKVFRMREHLDRLWDSAKGIWLEIPTTKEALADDITRTLAANQLRDSYIRVVVTRGAGTLGLDPNRTSDPRIIIIADRVALYPEETYQTGLDIVTVSVTRNHPASLSPRIKSLNYLTSILAKVEGLRAGCPEALMLNVDGQVSECTGANIFLVRHGRLMTPGVNAGILEGITRNAVLEIAREAGIVAEETALVKHDVYIADECFLTGSAAEIIPVVKVDNRTIGTGKPGPMTMDLRERFFKLARS